MTLTFLPLPRCYLLWSTNLDCTRSLTRPTGEHSLKVLTKHVNDLTIDFAHNSSSENFFILFALPTLHYPLDEIPNEMSEDLATLNINNTYRKTFGAMAKLMDRAVQNVTQTLSNHGLLEDTLIVFMSDNVSKPTPSTPPLSCSSWLSRASLSCLECCVCVSA